MRSEPLHAAVLGSGKGVFADFRAQDLSEIDRNAECSMEHTSLELNLKHTCVHVCVCICVCVYACVCVWEA